MLFFQRAVQAINFVLQLISGSCAPFCLATKRRKRRRRRNRRRNRRRRRWGSVGRREGIVGCGGGIEEGGGRGGGREGGVRRGGRVSFPSHRFLRSVANENLAVSSAMQLSVLWWVSLENALYKFKIRIEVCIPFICNQKMLRNKNLEDKTTLWLSLIHAEENVRRSAEACSVL